MGDQFHQVVFERQQRRWQRKETKRGYVETFQLSNGTVRESRGRQWRRRATSCVSGPRRSFRTSYIHQKQRTIRTYHLREQKKNLHRKKHPFQTTTMQFFHLNQQPCFRPTKNTIPQTFLHMKTITQQSKLLTINVFKAIG